MFFWQRRSGYSAYIIYEALDPSVSDRSAASIFIISLTAAGRSHRGMTGTWRPELPFKMGDLTLLGLAVSDNLR
jgi:hypothetical protein